MASRTHGQPKNLAEARRWKTIVPLADCRLAFPKGSACAITERPGEQTSELSDESSGGVMIGQSLQ